MSGKRLLILGFGYSAREIVIESRAIYDAITVTARSAEKCARLHEEGWNALSFEAGQPVSDELRVEFAQTTDLLISIAPQETGDGVLNTIHNSSIAIPALKRVFYLSTVGVYGDHQGRIVDETTPCEPTSTRSKLRLAAEQAWQDFAKNRALDLGIFRLSGIYGPARSAIDNLVAGTARRIVKPEQVFNRIHVGDIAGVLTAAMRDDGPLGVFNVTDSSPAPPQDVVAFGAQLLGMPCPPDIPFEDAPLSPMGRSFYAENKRVSNARVIERFGYTFRYPTYREGLAACKTARQTAV